MDRFGRSFFIFILIALLISVGLAAQDSSAVDDATLYPSLANSKPFKRWQWGFEQRAYPMGEIPEGAFGRAMEQIEDLELTRTRQRLLTPAANANTWVSIGPAPINSGASNYSGRVSDIAVDPLDFNHWLLGAAQGGVWETRDAGATWTPKTDSTQSLATGAIAFASSDPRVIYIGTGESAFAGDAFAGGGVLKSTDSGTSWQLLDPARFARTSCSDLKIDPANPDVVVVSTTIGAAGRGGIRAQPQPQTGLFKTVNGGLSWSLTRAGAGTDIEIDPSDFSRQLAGLGDIFGQSSNGLYRSTDRGDSWTRLDGPFDAGGTGRVEIAIAPSNPSVAYVSVQISLNQSTRPGGLLGIWKTDDVWAASPIWTPLPLPSDGLISSERQWWYDHDLVVDPGDPSVIFLGGVRLRKFDGSTWILIADSVHLDQQTMTWAGDRLVVGNDGGVYSSIDRGLTWLNHNTDLSITQFYDGSVHSTNPEIVIAGSQDNGTEFRSGASMVWNHIFGGDGGDCAISFTRPDEDWFFSFQGLRVVRTTDGGRNLSEAGSGIDTAGAGFIARIEKSLSNDNLVLAGSDNLWKTTDFFNAIIPSWRAIGPELRDSQGRSVSISAIALADSDFRNDTYAFGTADGRLMLTTNGGASWTDIDGNNAVPNRYVTDLAFDPNNAATLYVTLSGFDEATPGLPGHIFKTNNAVSENPNWMNISPPVNLPHNSVAVAQLNSSEIYVGTDVGVFASSNGGTSWQHHGPELGLPNVAVFDLQLNHQTGQLVAFTHGRGAFVNSTIARLDPSPILNSAVLSLNGQAVDHAPFGTQGLSITVEGQGFRPDTEITINGRPVLVRLPSDPALAGRQRIIDLDQNIDVRDSTGRLFLSARNLAPASGRSNIVSAGSLGPLITSIKVKRKGGGFDLKISGSGFQEGVTVEVNDQSGGQVPVRATVFIESGFIKAKVRDNLPTSGAQLRVTAIVLGGRSNEFLVVAP